MHPTLGYLYGMASLTRDYLRKLHEDYYDGRGRGDGDEILILINRISTSLGEIFGAPNGETEHERLKELIRIGLSKVPPLSDY